MISWVAMDRIVERQRGADAGYRKQAAGKVLRSDAKRLTDGDLLAKLHSFGIEMDRPAPVSYTHLDVYKRQAYNCRPRHAARWSRERRCRSRNA